MILLNIGDVIRKLQTEFGIEVSTERIRFYERIGLIKPKRSKSRFRKFSQDDYIEIKEIVLLAELGVPLDSIKDMDKETVDERLRFVKQAIYELSN